MCVVLGVFLVGKFWRFQNYRVEVSDTKENTLVYSYDSFNGNIIKCASDTASLTTEQNETLWTITYSMNNPQIVKGGSAFAIYDKNGTTVCVCNESGQQSLFYTDLPIIKADMAGQGTVALLTDDGSTAQIDYYDTKGSEIAAIRTTIDAEGYPMDIALSEDGLLLAVSYLRYEQNTYTGNVSFYSFGTAGQAQEDNIVGSFSYPGTIIPQVEFMGSDAAVAFGTDKIIAFQGSKAPQEKTVIQPEKELQSTFALDNCFGVVEQGAEQSKSEIILYNKSGAEKKRITTEFVYTSLAAEDGLLVLYNRNYMCVYTTGGILKFNSETDFLIRQICYVGANRYVLSASDSYNIIRLY